MKKLIWVGVSLNIIFFIFLTKAIWQPQFSLELKSPELTFLQELELSNTVEKNEVASKSSDTLPDSIAVDSLQKEFVNQTYDFPYTVNDSIKRILFVGDSQLENLRKPVRKRLMDNNYQLVASVVWYGSTTKQWANTDTLSYFISKYKPDFVLVALGLNEVHARDHERRKKYAQTIKSNLEQRKLPYYYIGPAFWMKDKGITTVLQETFGELFYPSHLLTLDRSTDGKHPSKDAANVWFEKVAEQITTKGVLNLGSVKDTIYRDNSETIFLKVPKND
jgi:lysophospholipase L1-like esterase